MRTRNSRCLAAAKLVKSNIVFFSSIFVVLLLMSYSIRTRDKNLGAVISSPQKGTGNDVVIAWNKLAYTIANEYDQFYSFTGVRALAMTHIAIHDALNAIAPEYEQYAFKGHEPGADKIAAVSEAAYEVLSAAYPKRKDTLNKELQKWVAGIRRVFF